MNQHLLPALFLATTSAMICAGCGGPQVVQVEPKFTVNGQPLKEASITFVRKKDDGGGRAAFGVTDENGIAKLTTYKPHDGVPPGSYSVVVIKAPENPNTFESVEIDPTDTEALLNSSSMGNQRMKRRQRRVRTLLPKQYSDPGTTPLECVVDSSTEDVVFEIQTK